MLIDSIFWDYGGVVADHYSEPYLGQLATLLGVGRKEARAALSEKTEHGALYRLDRVTPDQFWQVVQAQTSTSPFDYALAQELWAKTYIPNTAVLTMLRFLRDEQGLQTGIVLNEDRWRLQYIEDNYRLSAVVTHILASCDLGVMKPERRIYEEVLKRSSRQTEPSRVLYVDDRESHVDAARAVGMEGYCYTNAGALALFVGELIEAGSLCSAQAGA